MKTIAFLILLAGAYPAFHTAATTAGYLTAVDYAAFFAGMLAAAGVLERRVSRL